MSGYSLAGERIRVGGRGTGPAPTQILTSIVTATPFRVSFFGGGTDFPGYFDRRGGLVVATTIRKYTYVAINSLERLLEKRFRISYSRLEMVDTIAEIKHDIIRTTFMEYASLTNDGFVDLHSYADLPSGTGVGSSSAFTVGLLTALHTLNGIYLPPRELSRRAIHIEREVLQDVGGWQDQIMAAFGGFKAISFRDGDFEVDPLPVGAERRSALETSCWLYFTALSRPSAAIQRVSFSPANLADKERVLDQTRELAEEALHVFRSEANPRMLVQRWGELLDAAWTLKKSMSDGVTLPEIDRLYEQARRAGAYGGKIVGAGGGGFLLIVAPPERRAEIDAAVGHLHSVPIQLESDGGRVVYVNEK
jgi:D-glycero-alpha-D-manno-heptose-7-phosphate kinase